MTGWQNFCWGLSICALFMTAREQAIKGGVILTDDEDGRMKYLMTTGVPVMATIPAMAAILMFNLSVTPIQMAPAARPAQPQRPGLVGING